MVAEGRIAVIHYVGRLAAGDDAGAVFDTTDVDVALAEDIYHSHRDYRPIDVGVGAGEVIVGIEKTLRKMEAGETRTVHLDPTEAYGERSEARIVNVPRDALEGPDDAAAAEGGLVGSETGESGWITDVTEDTVEVDFNHELVGEPVEFELHVLDTRDPADEDDAKE